MARELGRPVLVNDVKPAAIAALAEVFGLELDGSTSVAVNDPVAANL